MIRTRFVPATDTKGARIRATVTGRQLTVPYDHAARDPHREVAAMLAVNLLLTDDPATVVLDNEARKPNRGWVFVINNPTG